MSKRDIRQTKPESADMRQLMALANQLSDTTLPRLDPHRKKEIARQIGFAPKRFSFDWFTFGHPILVPAACLVLLAGVLVLLSQSATPGHTLYNVKKGTDEIRVIVQPGFKQQLTEQQTMPAGTPSGSSSKSGQERSSTDKQQDTSGSKSSSHTVTKDANKPSGSNSSGSSHGGDSNTDSGSNSGSHGGQDD